DFLLAEIEQQLAGHGFHARARNVDRDSLPLGGDLQLRERSFDVFESRLQGGDGPPDLAHGDAQFSQTAQGFERDQIGETERLAGREKALLFPRGKLARGDAEHPANVVALPRPGGDRILFDALDPGCHWRTHVTLLTRYRA